VVGDEHTVGSQRRGLVGQSGRAGTDEHGVEGPAKPVRDATAFAHDFRGGLLELSARGFEDGEHGSRHQITFASWRSRRTNSGTASTPSPTILPAVRSAGGSRPSNLSVPRGSGAGNSSIGFFFAIMMPLMDA